MSGPMREKRAYWIGGTLAALLGVALVRVLAPGLEGAASSLVLAAGFLLVTIGLTILACATRRKSSEAFVVPDEDAKGGEPPLRVGQ
jgi:sulfite exporter TauE/SafE